MTHELYGLFANLVDKPVLVIGGGDVAARKTAALLRTGAAVTVGAPTLNAELATKQQGGQLVHRRGTYNDCWLDGFWLVVAATEDRPLNRRIALAADRRRLFVNVVDDPALSSFQVPTQLRRQNPVAAEADRQAQLQAETLPETGLVSLVGAGPGDPGLLTLRGLQTLQSADVILHDRLVATDLLDLARRDADFISVGKAPGQHSTPQQRTNQLLVAEAAKGRHVVRLKGGDPFIFGRGGEELEYLRAHGIAYEVIPGITAASACAAYAGVPLTHRDHAQSVRFVTAHCKNSLDRLDWAALAADRQTLAVYMGVAQLPHLRDQLLAHGRRADTPFALVENGTRHSQRLVTGTLEHLPEIAAGHAVKAPALLIVGEVAALADKLAWFGQPPLTADDLLEINKMAS